MRRLPSALGAIMLVTALSPIAAPPAVGSPTHHLDRIELPRGWQPEGITSDGNTLYSGSLANGAIWMADSRTGDGERLASGAQGRVAVGLDFDERRDLIWVAGGDTNKVRAQDADSGKVVARYNFPSETGRFLNDLVVTDRGVYVTDSFNQELIVIPFKCGHRHHDRSLASDGRSDGHGHDHGLPRPADTKVVPLTGDLAYQDGFNLNGIAASGRLVIAVQTNTGLLFRIRPWSGATTLIDLGSDVVTNGDGIELAHGKAYVVRNQNNLIAVVDLSRHAGSGRVVDELTEKSFDVPTTATFARGSLWAVNARFTTPPTPTTRYWITRVGLHG